MALLGILVLLAAAALADASSGGWGTVNWRVLAGLLVLALVLLVVGRRRRS